MKEWHVQAPRHHRPQETLTGWPHPLNGEPSDPKNEITWVSLAPNIKKDVPETRGQECSSKPRGTTLET